ncbi:MAG: hypothetical protein H8D45_11415 [Bacteroidetes bacterium]|nr:hypothetical protein [Bacteroidota bacterium]MBL7104358.1 hypothetical protein [Bacteroidales bacterium]
MESTNINTALIDSYFGLLKNLSPEIKLDLIERLTKTLKVDLSRKENSLQEAFGSWKSTKSAEEIIKELRESRNFNRQTEAL